MKQEQGYIDLAAIDISIEDFDAFHEKHEFSQKYQEDKLRMLKEYRKNIGQTTKRNVLKVAAAAAIVFISAPVLANAASDGAFFNRLWGTLGKKNIETHDEIVYDAEKDTSCIITYPKQEFVDIDANKAEELIGNAVSYEPVIREFGDIKLTILTAVSDGNAAVIEFTLEKEGGVDVLEYSQLDNETKGAWFSEDADFYMQFKDGSEKIYVDMEKSTNDMIYCYDYIARKSYNTGTTELIMEVYQYAVPRKELFDMEDAEIGKHISMEEISIPTRTLLQNVEYVNPDGGKISISTISLKIDMNTGLGLSEEDAYDPYHAYFVAVQYKDGTDYIVHEHELENVHACDIEIDNASYICGDEQNNLLFVFNRLVDINNIESITVNETQYQLK